jgi:hypothetical protein
VHDRASAQPSECARRWGYDRSFRAAKIEPGRLSAETQELNQTAALTSSRGAASGMTRTGSERGVPLQFGAGWVFRTKLDQERRAANSSTLKVATPVSVEKFYIETRSALPLGNAASGRCKAFMKKSGARRRRCGYRGVGFSYAALRRRRIRPKPASPAPSSASDAGSATVVCVCENRLSTIDTCEPGFRRRSSVSLTVVNPARAAV